MQVTRASFSSLQNSAFEFDLAFLVKVLNAGGGYLNDPAFFCAPFLYAQSMRTRTAILLFLLLAGCQRTTTTTVKEDANDKPIRRYALHGEVLRLDPQGKIAAIKHQKIGDWMEAMTMEFPVKDQKEFDTLRPGETIDATVFVQGDTNYWIGEVKEDTGPAPAAK